MNRCPITYDNCGSSLYSLRGLGLLSRGLTSMHSLEFTAPELLEEALHRAGKLSIQGVQPKLSAVFSPVGMKFELVDRNGKYILKPQHPVYSELPQNEDLTMRLASRIGIEVPFHGMVYSGDNTLTYFIRRFDREGHKGKVPVEDFAQLAGRTRDTKYDYSMEKLVLLIDQYCTFPVLEKIKLFRMVIFNFLVGNEDMHLKNYSLIRRKHRAELSPAYDLVNSTIVLKPGAEEIALPLSGRKKNLSRSLLVNYFGGKRCGLADKVLNGVLLRIREDLPYWPGWINMSFMSDAQKEKYLHILTERRGIMGF